MKTEDIKTWRQRIVGFDPMTPLSIPMQAEIDELRTALADRDAKLEALEGQEPMAWLVYANGSHRYSTLTFDVSKVPDIYVGGDVVALYAAAGAAPVPEGWQIVPNEVARLTAALADRDAKLEALTTQKPLGDGYSLQVTTGDTSSTQKTQRIQVIGMPVYAATGASPGKVVVTKTQDGQIVAVTRQDDEGQILSVIAEAAVTNKQLAIQARDALENHVGNYKLYGEHTQKHNEAIAALTTHIDAPVAWCEDDGMHYHHDLLINPGLKLYAAAGAAPVPDIDAMVSRFLSWNFPNDFYPDGHISFSRDKVTSPAVWPSGTNLLTAEQARKMFEYVMASTPCQVEFHTESAPDEITTSTR